MDYAATTPIDKSVLEAMMPYLKKEYGNPSSTHRFGQKARAAVEQAREQVAGFLGCAADEVIFTGGATAANNLAVQGVVKAYNLQRNAGKKAHIVATAIEHESVLEPCQQLEKEGLAEVTYVKPQKDGVVLAKDVVAAIKENTVLVSVQYANSEIGTVQPIPEIAETIRGFRKRKNFYPLFHSDCAQAANFFDCRVEKLGVDLLTLSGHKIYGPKGAGVLFGQKGVAISPLMFGGGQEMGLMSGTENVPAIVGMGQAAENLKDPRLDLAAIKIRQMRDKLIKVVLVRVPDSELTGSAEKRLANNAHFRFMGVEGRDLALLLDQKGIAVSTGSACSEKSQEPSHVLLALGLAREAALSSVRVSLGKHTKPEEVQQAVKELAWCVARLRKSGV